MLTLDEKKFAIEQLDLMKSYTVVRRSFRSIPGYHSKNLPSTAALRYIINKFEAHGTLLDRRSSKKRIISCKQVNEAKHLCRNKQRISLRIAARKLRFSTRKVSDILRICLLEKAFKAKIRLRLTECQRRNKVAASQALLEQKDVLQHTRFTDESWFFSNGIEQKRNQYFWALSKDAVESIQSQLAPIKVMVWGAVSVNDLIGQYFFHKNRSHIPVNNETYQDCITWFAQQLKSCRKVSRSYFLEDGTAPHTALTTRRMISDIFGDRVIGNHFRLPWPPYSPDLTPDDFWLWSTLKKMVFNNRNEPFSSVASLKRAITIAFNTLRSRNL